MKINIPKENLLDEILARESDRYTNQEIVMNRIVYDCIDSSPYKEDFLNSSQDDLQPFYIPMNLEDDTLIFESRFESGNLRRAIQVILKY